MQSRSRLLLVAWAAAFAWTLGGALLGEWWRAGREGAIATLIVVGIYLTVPAFYAASLEKLAALAACLVAIVIVALLTGLQVVFGHAFASTTLVANVACILTHAAMGGVGIAVITQREPRVALPAVLLVGRATEGAAEQAHAADGRRDGHE
jgi:hypothetical protein